SRDAFKQALAFLMTMPGIPVIYYGTEQAFSETRAAMFEGGYMSGGTDHYDPEAVYYKRIAKLAAIRKSSSAFTRGTVHVLADSAAGAGVLAYERVDGDQKAL